MSLSIILASRNRPDLLRPTIEATLKNITEPNTKFMIALDDDDDYTLDVLSQMPAPDGCLSYSVRPREDTIGEKVNRVLTEAPADAYLYMVDYAPHVTPGFDRKILDAAALFPDGIGVIYNYMVTPVFPAMNAMTHRLAELMGGFYPGWFPYWFVDHWLDDIIHLIGRPAAVAECKVETYKRPGTRDFREPAFWATLYDALKPERREIAERIITAPDFQCPEELKPLLRNSWPLTEQRSDKVNDQVRRMGNLMNTPADERYRRIKERALVKLRSCLTDLETKAAA